MNRRDMRAWPAGAKSSDRWHERRAHRWNTLRFALVFVVVNLHTLRRASEIGYMAIFALVSSLAIYDFIQSRPRTRFDGLGYMATWLAVSVYGLAVSVAVIGPAGAFFGLSRFLFAVPVLFAFVAYTDSRKDFARHIEVMCGFVALAALTVPLQMAVGPIAWFAEASERGGRSATVPCSATS